MDIIGKIRGAHWNDKIAREAIDEIKRLREDRDEWRQAAGVEAGERRRAHEEIYQLRKQLVLYERHLKPEVIEANIE